MNICMNLKRRISPFEVKLESFVVNLLVNDLSGEWTHLNRLFHLQVTDEKLDAPSVPADTWF